MNNTDAQAGLRLCCFHAAKSAFLTIHVIPVYMYQPSWCLRLGNVCTHALIRGVVHHIDTGLVQVGDKPLLHTSSEVVAVCLTVV